MKPHDVSATYDEATQTLTMTFQGLSTLTAKISDYCDQSFDKKTDVFLLRMSKSMTRFRFDGWTRNQENPSYGAIRQYAEAADKAVLEG